MRFLVGQHNQSTAPYLVRDNRAIRLDQIDARFGEDLMPIIQDSSLLELIDEQAPSVPVEEITPALPLKAPGKIVCLGLNSIPFTLWLMIFLLMQRLLNYNTKRLLFQFIRDLKFVPAMGKLNCLSGD